MGSKKNHNQRSLFGISETSLPLYESYKLGFEQFEPTTAKKTLASAIQIGNPVSRDKAIAYMKNNSSMAESDVVAEVERYIAIPGQALGYKIGQRVISNLRANAEERLGEKFDIRKFHRQVLIDGAMPLDVLTRKINDWIETEEQARLAGS